MLPIAIFFVRNFRLNKYRTFVYVRLVGRELVVGLVFEFSVRLGEVVVFFAKGLLI